jgi:hypothetical protein
MPSDRYDFDPLLFFVLSVRKSRLSCGVVLGQFYAIITCHTITCMVLAVTVWDRHDTGMFNIY